MPRPATSTRPSVDPRQGRREESARAERQLRDALARLLDTDWGRAIAAHILDEACVSRPAFDTNAMVMSSNAGKQELGLRFDARLRAADLDNYLKMKTENA